MNLHYFESIEEAEKFVAENGIKEYHFQTPEFLYSGVDLVIDEFVCDICKERTPIRCEGREPHTCAMCMPILNDDLDGEFINDDIR